MLVLEIIGWLILGFLGLNVIIYIIEPSLIAITFSLVLRLFFRNPPIVDVEQHFTGHNLLEEG